ncbi:MAG: A/G-specific adenine glycosylase [Janthinobacterium lividum]
MPRRITSAVLPQLSPESRDSFAKLLNAWYREHARVLPWRGIRDPYRTWLSEIMLQQTRVAAVLEHYARFVERFPTMVALALASEADVLAAWSGLGYYRRARMMHRTALLLVQEHRGALPSTAAELRRLPGIGLYTSAAIASIAFGERIAVVDGNVERVLLRILGQPETPGAAAAEQLNAVAQSLLPPGDPGDHNQAMMELGATVCLPRGPRCDVCPVFALCRTRGEHGTVARAPMRSQRAVYALATRKAGGGSVNVEILLQERPLDVSLMPGMLELPQVEGPEEGEPEADRDAQPSLVLRQEPVLRVRHAIVGTNYYVEVLALPGRREVKKRALRSDGLQWVHTRELAHRPLTGLARKVLQRLRLMKASGEEKTPDVPLLIGRASRAATGKES